MEILLIFGARSQALRCANMLRASAYRAAIVSAPAFASGGSCSLAVSTDGTGYSFFRQSAGAYSSLKGAYMQSGGKYTRIF